MLSEGWGTIATQCLGMWHKPEAKRICEGVTLSLNPPLRLHPSPHEHLYINFKTIEKNE